MTDHRLGLESRLQSDAPVNPACICCGIRYWDRIPEGVFKERKS